MAYCMTSKYLRLFYILLLIKGTHIYISDIICSVFSTLPSKGGKKPWSTSDRVHRLTFSWFLGEDWATWHIWHIFFEVSQGGTSRSVGKALKCQIRFRDFLMSAGQLGISGTFFSRFRREVRTDVYPSFNHDRSLPLSRIVGQAKKYFFRVFQRKEVPMLQC